MSWNSQYIAYNIYYHSTHKKNDSIMYLRIYYDANLRK